MNRRPLHEEEKKIWYSKFYDLPLETLTPEDEAALASPMDPEKAIPISNVMDFLKVKDEKEEVENGYCIGKDGHSYCICTEYYPELTVPMLLWWFSFIERRPAGIPAFYGNLRYKIWCPPDHINHGLLDPYNDHGPLFINETLDIGAGTMEPIESISIKLYPKDFGMSDEMAKELEEAGYGVIVGNGYGHGLPGGTGANVFKPVPEGGVKWSSIGYSGYQFQQGKVVLVPGIEPPTYADMSRELRHNITERRHLHAFLPELYAKQKDKSIFED